jgi:hypothetical protein
VRGAVIDSHNADVLAKCSGLGEDCGIVDDIDLAATVEDWVFHIRLPG